MKGIRENASLLRRSLICVGMAAGLAACAEVERAEQEKADGGMIAHCQRLAMTARHNDTFIGHATDAQYFVEGRPSTDELSGFYREIGYGLPEIRRHSLPVPRIVVAKLPLDLQDTPDTARRKAVFLATVLPLALHVNETIRRERSRMTRLLNCRGLGQALPDSARAWLAVLHEKYGTGGDAALLRNRVDVIPVSLILAQAAIESGWGTSRFALQGNALFGQRTYGGESGLLPNGVDGPAGFRVRSFANIYESIEAYANNLNVTPAYKTFRDRRAARRAAGGQPTGTGLARFLHRYSERGADYVADLVAIVDGNDLDAFDGARLEPAVLDRARRTVRFWTNAARG